jgi:hypothetical protein
LPENTQAQDLVGVDAVLVRTAQDQFSVTGMVYASDESKTQLSERALGVMDQRLDLSLTNHGLIYLEAVADKELAGYLRGKIELGGRRDNQGLLCTLTPHQQ